MSCPTVMYLVINLLSSADRRENMLAQAATHGLDIEMLPAVSGAELTAEQRACYDENRLRRYYNYRLTVNEIACVLSHRKAMETFLASKADFLVLLEDDVELSPHFKAGICELTEHLRGWEVAKLNIAFGRARSIPLPSVEALPEALKAVFNTRFGSGTIGFVYTRHAARIIYEGLAHFYLPADSMIYQLILEHRLPTIAMDLLKHGYGDTPSCIPDRAKGGRRTLAQYLRHRLRVYANNLRKRSLYRAVCRRVHRV